MRLSAAPLIEASAIHRRVHELAVTIAADYADRDLLLLIVLKGGMFFGADLARALGGTAHVDCVRARSYDGTDSTGEVRFGILPEISLRDRHVLVLEDILDTGRTATALLQRLHAEAPASLEICTLLDKPTRRVVPIEARYVGFEIEDHFVVGYGLDYAEQYRNLPYIGLIEA